jgi:MFS family permease
MAYGFSVFWLPLSHALGAGHTLPCTSNANPFSFLFDTQCNWTISLLGWTYTLFFVFLGSSAALWGAWLERVGPRKAGIVAAFCWCGGLMLAAIAVRFHQLWLLWLGAGVIGGIGLGLGYISPVSTLLKWFPDRRGMAAGLAIMGFGGGALIGAPLAEQLMAFYATSTSVGVWETLLTLAFLYFIFMMAGALNYRLPPDNWQPAVSDKASIQQRQFVNTQYVPVSVAWKTPQFWLLWLVLCLNVSAGIGIIGMASPMLQEVFAGHLLGIGRSFDNLTFLQKGKITAMAAGFTGFLSLFNIAGRFVWASCSDYWGRKRTYAVFLALGSLLYATVPLAAHGGHIAWFILIFCILLSMYGGGFATIPAYLADLFGTRMATACT